jgi:hypothetical protein
MKGKLPQNLHFYISIPVVFVAALVYGFQPDLLFEIQPNSTDENNLFKAIMGLYLAFAGFWCYALYNPSYWRSATLSNALFMFGLAFGRAISLLTDGIPSLLFLFGFLGEFVLAIYGSYLLKAK